MNIHNPSFVPHSSRKAGTAQGIALMLPMTMAVMGAVVMSPVLPSMQEHFKDVPNVEYLVPWVLTTPALCIALLSSLAGAAVDFIGRRTTLIVALLVYAVVGVLPMFLDSLPAIIISRVALGIMEALIVTSSTTLIGDYFKDAEREKWLGYQTAFASISAVILLTVAGMLGNISWRAPFLAYLTSMVFALVVLFLTWEPQREATDSNAPKATGSAAVSHPWGAILAMCAVAVFGGVMFFTLQIQLGYILSNLYSITSPGTIGLLTALVSLAVPAGAIVSGKLTRLPVAARLTMNFAIIGISFMLMKFAASYQVMLALAVVNQFGCGMLLPTLAIWIMARLPFAIRGRGTGLFMSSWFIGQVISPQALTLLNKQMGGLMTAIQVFGVLCVIAAVIASRQKGRSDNAETPTAPVGMH